MNTPKNSASDSFNSSEKQALLSCIFKWNDQKMNKLPIHLIMLVCSCGFVCGGTGAPSVWYGPTNDNFPGDIVIRTIKIPYDTLNTYYSVINWNAGMDGGGYCGLQTQAAGHEYHFSIWDPGNHQAITVPYMSAGTTVQPFGGEGTGLKATNLTLGWNNGQWYSTAVRCWGAGTHSYFGYWIHDHSGDKWTHLITMDFPMPNIRFSTGNGGFIEDWAGSGSQIRRYHIKGCSKRSLEGAWYGMSQCRITANPFSDGTYDWNFNGGIENDYYFVESGGKSIPDIAFGGGRSATFSMPQSADPQDPVIAFSIVSVEPRKIYWDVPISSTPQFRYTIKINGIEVASAIEPEARSQSVITNTGDTIELILEDILGRTALATMHIYPVGEFNRDAVKEFGLKEAAVQNAIVYYDPALESKLPAFKTRYGVFKDEVLLNLGIAEDKIVPVCDAINRIVGTDREEAKMAANRVLLEMNQVVGPFTFDTPTFYLVQKESIKEYLRQGGSLPHFSYDKPTDTASYELRLYSFQTGEKIPFECVFPIDTNEVSVDAITGGFDGLSDIFRGMGKSMAIHEAAEVTLLFELNMNSQDCYRRWFTDGFANATAYQVLNELYSQKDADDYAAAFSTKPDEDLRTQINLRYWMAADYEFFDVMKPFKAETRIQQARYNFATQEAMGLIERHGADCLRKILDVYCKRTVRNSAGLYDAIAEVTGEGLDSAFMKYQSFADAREGLKHYTALYEAADKKNDETAKIEALLRMIELYDSPFGSPSLTARKEIALLLTRTGQQDLGDRGILAFTTKMMTAKGTVLVLGGMELLMVYAGQTNRLEIAGMYADAIWKQVPQAPSAVLTKTEIARFQQQSPKAIDDLRQTELKSDFYKKAKQLLESRQK